MSPRSTTSGANTDEPVFLRSGDGGPADPDLLGGAAGRAARLPADGTAERRCQPRDISVRALAVRGRTSAPGPYVLIDDLNIVFIVLNTFVGFTTSIFSASYIAHELESRPVDAGLPALLPRHVPDHDVRHESRFRVEQYRLDVGRGRNRDADDGADGRHLSHPRRAGSGLEIFHPGQRRNCVRSVRHDPGLHGGASGRGRRPGRHGLDAADRTRGELRPGPSQCRFRIPVSRLRHQGRPRAAACLAARRARRRSDADIGRAVGPAC